MLYNKYRPRKFEDVAGNEATKKDLQSRSASKAFPHVMMFIGKSGTGKSTLANIVAATMNCKSPVEGDNGYEPCGECDACRDVFEGRYSRDVHFYDGSDLGKEAVEGIRDQAMYDPMYDNKNVVIIDEAQNISAGGLEMALKLLEIERENTHFILCTMHPEKFKAAIRSRGQVYRFEKLPEKVIAEYLFNVLEAEDPNEELPDSFVEEGLITVSEHSDGSLRQAISTFERCVNSELFTRDAIEAELRVVSEKKTYVVLLSLLKKDPDFFKDLQHLDLKSFFYYSWEVLTQTATLSFTIENEDQEDWRVKSARKLLRFESFWDLLDLFYELHGIQSSYFNENAFLTALVKFYRESAGNVRNMPPKLEPKDEPRKVRRVKRG